MEPRSWEGMGPEAPVVGIGSHRSAVSHKPVCLLKWLPGQSSPTPRSAVTCVFQPAVAYHKAIKNHLDLSVPDDPAEFAGLGAHVPPYCHPLDALLSPRTNLGVAVSLKLPVSPDGQLSRR